MRGRFFVLSDQPEEDESVDSDDAEHPERETSIVEKGLLCSYGLHEKEAQAAAEQGWEKSGREMKDEDAHNEQDKKSAAENDAGSFFTE